ncbi:Adaptive-response sensory-kinase SasA [bioreactor metagenome]|uniref:Adaptive-response sensory-kinase SasA n=1 Tax=bioreactor metagenome TaxID=1076179 RepID=A0A644Y5G2_9ZZZZ|nr:ATP-binding protein [Oscillibacter sp.]MEA4994561.1 ATP-binding protein [Oscillibacter sp.]
MENYECEEAHLLASLFPSIATQMRGMLSGLYLAATALAPAEAREQDPELDRKAARLDQQYYQMLRLVNCLSAAARLDGRTPLPMQDCDLVGLLRDVCDEAEGLARLMNLKLTFNCALPQLICAADPDSIRQLLFQLLSNAFKFTPAGGSVTVTLRRTENHALLEVEDTGCGINDLHMKALFDHYSRREPRDPPPHGLGLGLPLCLRIVEDHGGRMAAESRLGTGSRFTARLPIRRSNRSGLSDARFDYTGGFNQALLGLADALPTEAFVIRNR